MLAYQQPESAIGMKGVTKMVADPRKALLAAIVVAGTLDILSAFAFNAMVGVTPGQVLRYVAAGPFGDGMHKGGVAAATLGLGVHFALMAVMVAVYFAVASRIEAARRHWVLAGALYGIVVYLVMNWLVVPTRFGTEPSLDPWKVGNALFSHIVCVGLPIAWMASRALQRRDWAPA